MSEKPILFSAEMVRAILEGRKTQTRLVIKPQPKVVHALCNDYSIETNCIFENSNDWRIHCPYGRPGDRLWVRETHYRFGHWVKNGYTPAGRQRYKFVPDSDDVLYFDNEPIIEKRRGKNIHGWYKRPSIFMPQWASRINLLVKDIRVERVQDISDDDAFAEGIDYRKCKSYCTPEDLQNNLRNGHLCWTNHVDYRSGFCLLWDSINAKRGYSWESNPWVWVVEFEEYIRKKLDKQFQDYELITKELEGKTEQCHGNEGPCENIGTWRRQNTQFYNERSNWDCLCGECQKYRNEHWDEMWAMYYSQIL